MAGAQPISINVNTPPTTTNNTNNNDNGTPISITNKNTIDTTNSIAAT